MIALASNSDRLATKPIVLQHPFTAAKDFDIGGCKAAYDNTALLAFLTLVRGNRIPLSTAEEGFRTPKRAARH